MDNRRRLDAHTSSETNIGGVDRNANFKGKLLQFRVRDTKRRARIMRSRLPSICMSATEPSEALPKEDAHSAILALHSCDERVAELIISVVANCDYEQSDTDNNEGKVSKKVMQVKKLKCQLPRGSCVLRRPQLSSQSCHKMFETITDHYIIGHYSTL